LKNSKIGDSSLYEILSTNFDLWDTEVGKGSTYQAVADKLGIKLTEDDAGHYSWALVRAANEAGFDDPQEWINNLLNQNSESYDKLINDFSSKSEYSSWFQNENNIKMLEQVNQGSLDKLYSELSYISKYEGEESGRKYLDSLMGIINESGIEDSDKKAKALETLLSLDYSDWNID
jgi:hypothetical protein